LRWLGTLGKKGKDEEVVSRGKGEKDFGLQYRALQRNDHTDSEGAFWAWKKIPSFYLRVKKNDHRGRKTGGGRQRWVGPFLGTGIQKKGMLCL